MVKIYVEGGGNKLLNREGRKAFKKFFESLGFSGRLPTVVLCGPRLQAFDGFKIAVSGDQDAMLLVDSEAAVADQNQSPQNEPKQWKPWAHLKHRTGDEWDKPENADDLDCHLMVEEMEAWFLADRDALATFFGKNFNANALPAASKRIESISKSELNDSLKNASKNTKKGNYDKGKHEFQILELIDPKKVIAASPWAKRWIDALQERTAS